MARSDSTLTIDESNLTQHAMLIVWGHFGRTIGLLDQLAKVPIAQKKVLRAPQEKITEFLIGLLSGMEYLTDLSEGPAPLTKDAEVSAAWKLHTMADASGVSRTLRACNEETVQGLAEVLDAVSQPFIDRAVSDVRQRNEALLLDADLTGRPVSSTSQTFPDAAFGYMDGEVRLGYQLAQICLDTSLFGRQWLSAQHHPGNIVSAGCLLSLVQEAERRLGCHPRRRTELVAQRLSACEQEIAEWQQQITRQEERAIAQAERALRLAERIGAAESQVEALQTAPASSRQVGPYSQLNRLKRQIIGWRGQMDRAHVQVTQAKATAARHRECQQERLAERIRLQERYERLCHENARQWNPPRCCLRMDAGFATGENLTAVIELGYEVDTKSPNDALVQALRQRVAPDQEWTRVGKNAEMIGWSNYESNTCPYPLTVGLERFHTPQGVRHAVLIRSQEGNETACPDLPAWFHDYNARQTIEAGNKEEKTTFKVQHLMSRSPAGIQIQAMLTVFVANFVRWAGEWIRPRVEQSSRRFDGVLSSPKRLVRVAANSPAAVERSDGRLLVRFSALSSFEGVVIRLSGVAGLQLPLPLFTNDHFSRAVWVVSGVLKGGCHEHT
jgi:hypothetical protein